MQAANPVTSTNQAGEPTWDVARLFPNQGTWSEHEYLELKGNRLIEFSCGTVEFLPTATTAHQLIVVYLYRMLAAFVEPRKLGLPLVAPLRVRTLPGKLPAASRPRAGDRGSILQNAGHGQVVGDARGVEDVAGVAAVGAGQSARRLGMKELKIGEHRLG